MSIYKQSFKKGTAFRFFKLLPKVKSAKYTCSVIPEFRNSIMEEMEDLE